MTHLLSSTQQKQCGDLVRYKLIYYGNVVFHSIQGGRSQFECMFFFLCVLPHNFLLSVAIL